MSLAGIDRETAERLLKVSDRTRIGYVRHAYGVDGGDPSLYHLMVDSTALDLDTYVDLIVAASQARVGARPSSQHPEGRHVRSPTSPPHQG